MACDTIDVCVKLYPPFAELAETSETRVEVRAGGTVRDVLDALNSAYPILRNLLDREVKGGQVMILLNDKVSAAKETVKQGDTVGLLSPTMGG